MHHTKITLVGSLTLSFHKKGYRVNISGLEFLAVYHHVSAEKLSYPMVTQLLMEDEAGRFQNLDISEEVPAGIRDGHPMLQDQATLAQAVAFAIHCDEQSDDPPDSGDREPQDSPPPSDSHEVQLEFAGNPRVASTSTPADDDIPF